MKEGDIYMNGIFHNPNDAWRPRPQNPDDFEAMTSAGCLGGMVMLVVMFIAFAIIAIFTGCSPKIIEREVVKTDTCYIQKERRDSIYMKDSVYVKEWIQGDTVRIETTRWRDRWRERIIRDTAYIASHDTIRVTTTREVAKPMSSWQSFQIWVGRIALIVLIAFVVVYVRKKILYHTII